MNITEKTIYTGQPEYGTHFWNAMRGDDSRYGSLTHGYDTETGTYFEKYDKYAQRYEALKAEFNALEQERQERRDKYDVIGAFISTLEASKSIPLEFDDDTFTAVIEKITVYADEHIDFTFSGGVTITEQL